MVINEDYVEPADFVAAVRRAGLDALVWTPTDATAADARRAGARDRRLVLLAEHRAGARPGTAPAYERVAAGDAVRLQEPGAARGARLVPPQPRRATAPLLLVNHWITTDPAPLPSNAARVNARGPLLARARECTRLRGHTPNLIAVNFYRRGDLFAVVDELNGVRARTGADR